MSSTLPLNALLLLCCYTSTVQSFYYCGVAPRTSGGTGTAFIGGFNQQASRKRRRDGPQSVMSIATLPHRLSVASPAFMEEGSVQVTTAGSFVAGTDGGRGWLGRNEARSCRQLAAGRNMDMYQLHFEPPDMHSIMASVGRVLFWGTAGAIQMKYMKERLREKEQGLEVDDQWEETMRANEEYGEDDTYVCTLCDNENEIDCDECGGKGFFVSDSAQPSKCDVCNGFGKIECPECEDRREWQRQNRSRRPRPLSLPSGRGDDDDDDEFPVNFPFLGAR